MVDDTMLDLTAPQTGPEKLLVVFTVAPVLDKLATHGGTVRDEYGREQTVSAAGRPIYKQGEFIRIAVPGDTNNVVVREIRDSDRQRFAQKYAAWKAGRGDDRLSGTYLSECPSVCTPTQAKELEFYNVRTVEQLAVVPDSVGDKFMGFQALKQRAAAYLELAKGKAPLDSLRMENNDLRGQLEAAQKSQADLLARMEKLEKGQNQGQGNQKR